MTKEEEDYRAAVAEYMKAVKETVPPNLPPPPPKPPRKEQP